MTKKKACRKCRLFVEGDICPLCKSTSFSNSWQGRLYISDPIRSLVAEKVGINLKGEYALKVR